MSKKKDLLKIIETNSKWGESRCIFMISRFLDIKNKTDKYVKIYAQHGHDYQQQIENDTGKNQSDAKELENYRDYDY